MLEIERDGSSGVLVALRGGGRDYLDGGARRRAHAGTASAGRGADRRGLPRCGRCGRWRRTSFTEEYRWTGDDLTLVDGVEVRRDARGRVVACLPGGPAGADRAPVTHRWWYTHDDHGLVEVRGPASPAGSRSGRTVASARC